MESKRVISIDASTTTIGIAILDHQGKKAKLTHHEFFKPSKQKKLPLLSKLLNVKQYMKELNETWKPDVMCIEDIIQFMPNKSSAKTIISLAILNRTIGLTWYEMLDKEPELWPVIKVRHAIKYGKELPSKEDIPELVARRLGIEFPYYKKINRRSKKEEICVESYDVADAIAVGLAHIIKS